MSSTHEAVASLSRSYDEILPLLNYLKVRLKYDTVRWLRTLGRKDDIVFSTRIKTFDRVLEKLVRKQAVLKPDSKVLDFAVSGQGVLDDLIGIRFICFDPYRIYNLMEYFLITERVVATNREFYVSSKAGTNPLARFLTSSGFKQHTKPDREYEDINFVLRFSHPIDRYFRSGKVGFQSLAQRAEPPDRHNEKLIVMNKLFENLDGALVDAIPQMPIECQIVTATQHIYNRTQRPHYEYILQAKDGEPALATSELVDLNERLELLKFNLLSVEKNVYSIHRRIGIRYGPPMRINVDRHYSLIGRLPKDILGLNSAIEQMNSDMIGKLTDPSLDNYQRKKILKQMFDCIKEVNDAISQRSADANDIALNGLLEVVDFEEIDHPVMVFWALQRSILLMLCVIILYAKDEPTVDRILSEIRFLSVDGAVRFSDPQIAAARIFEKLEHVDNAINLMLLGPRDEIRGWRDGYFNECIFSDPLIQWRYATLMYSKREHLNALQEMKVAASVFERLDEWESRGVKREFMVPAPQMFLRRRVEYELCAEIKSLTFEPATVAGMMDLCGTVLTHKDDWNAVLDEASVGADAVERARCLSFRILFALCVMTSSVSSGASLAAVREEFRDRFDEVNAAVSDGTRRWLSEKTWWLLVSAIMEDAPAEKLRQFDEKIGAIDHHPSDRIQFEHVCAKLIQLWLPPEEHKGWSHFTEHALLLLRRQTQTIAGSAVISKDVVKHLSDLVKLIDHLLKELRSKGRIEAPGSSSVKAVAIQEEAGHFVVDTAVAGLRSIIIAA